MRSGYTVRYQGTEKWNQLQARWQRLSQKFPDEKNPGYVDMQKLISKVFEASDAEEAKNTPEAKLRAKRWVEGVMTMGYLQMEDYRLPGTVHLLSQDSNDPRYEILLEGMDF